MLNRIIQCFTALCLVLASSIAYASKTITIATGEWPPWVSGQLKTNGVAADIVSTAFHQVGIDVRFKRFPWQHALSLAETGSVAATMPWAASAQRQSAFIYSEPIFASQTALFHLKTHPLVWQHYRDLQKLTLGVTAGYFYGEDFQRAYHEGLFISKAAPTDVRNLTRLLDDSIRAFPIDIDVGYYLLNQHFASEQVYKVSFSPQLISTQPMHLIATRQSPQSAQLIQQFNLGLKKLGSKRIHAMIRHSRAGSYVSNSSAFSNRS